MVDNKTEVEAIINNIVQLQTVAEEAYLIERDKRIILEELDKLQNKFNKEEEKCLELEEKTKEIEQDNADKQGEIQEQLEGIKKIKTKEKMVKTQKEYLALDAEKSIKDERIKELEKVIKDNVKELEAAKKDLDKKLQNLGRLENKLNTKKEEVKLHLEESQQKIDKIDEVRKDVIPQIPEDILNRYQQIVENKDGIGIVPITDGICQGCNLYITPQVISKIRKKDEIIYCNNCARMLYLP